MWLAEVMIVDIVDIYERNTSTSIVRVAGYSGRAYPPPHFECKRRAPMTLRGYGRLMMKTFKVCMLYSRRFHK